MTVVHLRWFPDGLKIRHGAHRRLTFGVGSTPQR